MVSEILSILLNERGGACHPPPPPGGHPGVSRSMSLNAPYLKEQEYNIWFMGGDLNGFQDIKHFVK